jgi:hypothetical protein
VQKCKEKKENLGHWGITKKGIIPFPPSTSPTLPNLALQPCLQPFASEREKEK